MSSSRIPSPARSQGVKSTPRRYKSRASRSVGSPARSNNSLKLSAVIQMEMDSFVLSPMPTRSSVLTDTTDIDMPRRKSWWRRLDENPKDIMEVISTKEPVEMNDAIEEYIAVDVLSQEKKNYSLQLPDSSDGESISSIVVPQRKLFTQKESQPQTKFGQVIDTRESLAKLHKSQVVNETALNIGPKILFNKGPQKKSKSIFPTTLLHSSANKTIENKQKQLSANKKKDQVKSLFKNQPGTKRKNMFSEFIVSDSEDEIPEIQLKVFGFQNNIENRHAANRNEPICREPSPSSVTDIEMDDWRLLPSSTMVEHQLEDGLRTTPIKRARLIKISEPLEPNDTMANKSKKLNTNMSTNSKNTSKNSSKHTKMNANYFNSLVTDEEPNASNNQIQNKSSFVKRLDTSGSKNSSKHTLRTEHKSHCKESVDNKSNQNKSLKATSKIDQVLQSDDDEDFTLEYENDDEHEPVEKNNETQITTEINIKNMQQKLKATGNSISKNISVSKQLHNTSKSEKSIQQEHQQRNEESNQEKNVCSEQNDFVAVGNRNNLDLIRQSTDLPQIINKIYQNNTDIVTSERKQSQSYDFENNDIKCGKILSADQVAAENVEHIENDSVGIEVNNMEVDNQDKGYNNRSDIEKKNTEDYNEQKNHEEAMKSHKIEHGDENAKQRLDEAVEDEKDNSKDIHGKENDHINSSNVIQKTANEEVNTDELNCNQEQVQDYVEDKLKRGCDKETQNSNQRASHENHEGKLKKDGQDENEVQDNNKKIIHASEQNISQSQDEEDEMESENEEEIEMDNEDEIEIYNENETDMHSDDDVDEDNGEEVEIDDRGDDVDEEDNEKIDNEESQDECSNIDTEQNESQDKINSTNVSNESEDQDGDDDSRDQSGLKDPEEHAEINATHNTTTRHSKKQELKITSPEAILHDKTKQIESFTVEGRNTSVWKNKSITRNLNIRQSLAPIKDSIGLTDGTRDSSAEGSGWDSHRTTRITLRKTFGKDFTPRKSLRTLVMEKSAKRQTNFNDGNVDISKLPQANSTKLPEAETFCMDEADNIQATEESDHEVSRTTRQTTLETYLQKIKNQNIERKKQLEIEIRNSLKAPKRDMLNPFKVPAVPKLRRSKIQPVKEKTKPIKSSVIPLDMLPAEILEDMKYKPPKRYQPPNASWITKRLYAFLETKLEPKYDYRARVRAEKLVESLYQFTKDIRRQRRAPPAAVRALQLDMARLGLVRTHFEFYEFFHEFMPREVRLKVVPDLLNEISLPKHGVFTDIR